MAIEFCRHHGVMASKVSEIINNKEPAIYKVIQEGIDRVNAKATSNAQKVQKWTLLSRDFSISGGELGKELFISKCLCFLCFIFLIMPEICKTVIQMLTL